MLPKGLLLSINIRIVSVHLLRSIGEGALYAKNGEGVVNLILLFL
jgi:hypothetical protein